MNSSGKWVQKALPHLKRCQFGGDTRIKAIHNNIARFLSYQYWLASAGICLAWSIQYWQSVGKKTWFYLTTWFWEKKNILPPNFGLKYFLINGARALPWRQFSYFQEWAMNKRPSAKKIGFRFQDKLLLQKTGHGFCTPMHNDPAVN